MKNKGYRTTWDLSQLFSGDDDPRIASGRTDTEKAVNGFVGKWKSRKDYLTDPVMLRQALDDYEELMRNFGQSGSEGYYFWLRSMQDQSSPDIKARQTKATDFGVKNVNLLQFFEINLSKIDPAIQAGILASPQVTPYRHFLEKLFVGGKYTLSDAEERILNLKEVTSYERWKSMLSDFLSREEREVLQADGTRKPCDFSRITSLVNEPQKPVRDDASRALNEILVKHVDVAEAELNAVLEHKKSNDLIRGMDRPDLSRHIGDDIDSAVVDTLVRTVADRFDIPKRFYALKAQLLGVRRLEYHERNVETGSVDRKYPFEESVGLVERVFRQLDPQFADIFRRFLENGQIDVYPHSGKRGGAFCSYWLITHPTYVLLNHTDTLTDVRTIAHEMGHGINNELIREKQNALNFGTPMATAEVASTFMEDFVLNEILRTADDETRLALQVSRLNADVSSLFRQIALYRFELELHGRYRESGYLSHKEIGALFQKHMSAYMGDAVEQSPGSGNWWIHWWHIRTYFYVYSYASGLLISKSLQSMVKRNRGDIAKVKEFLSTGLSQSPSDIFGSMGIDIHDAAFWNTGLGEISTNLDETEKLARKLGKVR